MTHAMFTVVAMDVNESSQCAGSTNEFRDSRAGNVIVADGKMNVAQTILASSGHVGLATVHTHDCLYPQPCEFPKGHFTFRLRARDQSVGDSKDVVQAGCRQRRRTGGGLSGVRFEAVEQRKPLRQRRARGFGVPG
jgi:hypothetical protein